MNRLSAYFISYFGLFSFLLGNVIGNVSCNNGEECSKGYKSTKEGCVEESYPYSLSAFESAYGDEGGSNCTNCVFVSNHGWGAEDSTDATDVEWDCDSYALGTICNPYPTIDEAIDNFSSSTPYIYIEGNSSATETDAKDYSTNIVLDSTNYNGAYFVGVNSPTITPADNTLVINHTIELSDVSGVYFGGLIIQGISATVTDTSSELTAATVSMTNASATFYDSTTVDLNYYQAFLLSGTSELTLDTMSITGPRVGMTEGNSYAVYADSGTTLDATDVTVTGFDRGFVAFEATLNVTATNSGSSQNISGAGEVAIYYSTDSTGTVTKTASADNTLAILTDHAGNVMIDEIYAATGSTVRLCGDNDTAASYAVTVQNSIISEMEIGGYMTVSDGGVANTITTLTLDPDATNSMTATTPITTLEADVDCGS